MPTYKLLENSKMNQLIDQLKSLQKAISPVIEFLSKTDGTITLDSLPSVIAQPLIFEQEKIKIGKGGTKLADLIYESIGETQFSPQTALAVISAKTNWNPPRAVDSIRVALNKDPRFERMGKNYRKNP
jgi:hypothetical protein